MNVKFCRLEGDAMILMLIMAAAVPASATSEAMENKSVLDVIHGMREVAAERAAVEALFGAKITEVKDNGYWTYHEGPGATYDDGSRVRKFGFSTKNDGRGMAVYADLAGECLPFAQIKQRYPEMMLGSLPSPHSSTQHFGYTYRNEDGDMSFVFSSNQRRPECLVNTGFRKKIRLLPPSP